MSKSARIPYYACACFLRQGGLREADVRAILRQVLEALVYAHGKGVIHRDLKPANILLKRGPRGSGTKASAGWAGTIDFMAPEVREGRRPDARADLYAVGVMGYSLLTGRRPLGRCKDASRLVPGLDPAWDDWLDSLMAVESEERTADAAAALATLPNPAAEDLRSEDVQKERRASVANGTTMSDRSAADGRTVDEGGGSRSPAAKARGSFRWVLAAVPLLAAGTGAWRVGVPPLGCPVAEARSVEVRLQN